MMGNGSGGGRGGGDEGKGDAGNNGSMAGDGSMTSSRPYLLRAVYDWINDNGLTPQVVVDADVEGVQVPLEYVHEGRIVLNISATAVRNLNLGNDWVTFGARFGGRPFEVFVPTHAVLAVLARESGAGMSFPQESAPGMTSADSTDRPHLRPIDGPAGLAEVVGTLNEHVPGDDTELGSAVRDSSTEPGDDDGPGSSPQGKKGPPNLRVVK